MLVIRARETGSKIESFNTLEEAKATLLQYEKEDEENEIFEPNFYEIYDEEKEEIIY